MSTVDIEWVGDPPLMDDLTKFRIATGDLPPMAAAVMRGAESQRNRPISGVTIRAVDPEFFGVSRKYTWGPENFVVAVEDQDVDKILGDPYSGHQFRRVGDPDVEIIRPASNFVLVSEVDGASLTDVYS